MAATPLDLQDLATRLQGPILIVSTVVGRGMYSLGEALEEYCSPRHTVVHIAIEDYLPGAAVNEDLRRYKLISSRLPWLLYLVYKLPVFYYRKYLRELLWATADLQALKSRIDAGRPRTVLCVSHRPAFWISSVKRRERMDFQLWGVLGEYGPTLGWRYVFWEQIDGFLSPLDRSVLPYRFPDRLAFSTIALPARRAYSELATHPGHPGTVLLVCGYWGQGPILKVVRSLLAEGSDVRVIVVCGENRKAYDEVTRAWGRSPQVAVHGVVPSLLPFLRECSCVVTKPGISTLLEAHAARRKIFLLPGMPVAEDHNADHALQHFGAEWFSKARFREWRRTGSA